jgi:hypothetical protein
MMKAVIDRFEGKYAVLLLGDGERQINVERDQLPEKAMEGSWLQVEMEGDAVAGVVLDDAETRDARKRISEKLERLRRGDHLKK